MSEIAAILAVLAEEMAVVSGHVKDSFERIHVKFQALSSVDWDLSEDDAEIEKVEEQNENVARQEPVAADVYVPSFASAEDPDDGEVLTNRAKKRAAIRECIMRCVQASGRSVRKQNVIDFIAKHSGYVLSEASVTKYLLEFVREEEIKVAYHGRLAYFSMP